MPYNLVPPDGDHEGLGYQALIVNWMQWLVMEHPDENNDGIVVYLRGVDFTATGGSYSVFIRGGPNRFIISPEQAVFWPIIMYFVDKKHHQNANDPPQRLNQVINLMRSGDRDNPVVPDQAMIIENENPATPVAAGGYQAHRFISNTDFELQIPRQDYPNPTSLCTLLDVPLRLPGPSPCRVAGYFLLLRFDEGRYQIISHGHGEMGYQTSTFVEIEVTEERDGIRLMNQLQRQGVVQ
jgi:hypothetical protein